MFKKILALVFAVYVSLNFMTFVSAQEEAEPTKRWFCLEADRASVHGARLFIKDGAADGEKPLPNHDTIIVECISTDEGQQCTTGDDGLDQQLYGGSQISAGLGYSFEGLTDENGATVSQPIPGNPTGTFTPVIWQDSTPDSHERRWLGLNLVQPKPDIEMGLGGEQLGTFDFEFALKKCANIAWDPYGRVFDSQSLEPVAGASVTLLKQRDTGIFTYVNPRDPNDITGGALVNPVITKEDGAFSFVVPDGTYKLSVQKSGYTFPSFYSNVDFKKAYSDIYPEQTGSDIVQAGAIQHRDIPVDSESVPVLTPAKIMEYSYESDKIGDVTVQGRVSHPLSVVSFYSVMPDESNQGATTRYRLLTTVRADKLGRFSATIDQSTFDHEVGEAFGEVEPASVNLRDMSQNAPGKVLKLEPIPSYLEGYAYDKQGNPLSNAKVSVVQNFSKKAYYETTTSSDGYFKVNSDYLPFYPYRLTYSSAQSGTVDVSTSKFLTDNARFIKENRVESFKPNYADPKLNEQVKSKIEAITSGAAGNITPGQEDSQGLPAGTSNIGFIAMVGLIIVLLIAAGGVVAYMVKRNGERPY